MVLGWRYIKRVDACRRASSVAYSSLGSALYDLGLDREARKAALGHTSDAASMVYERGGDRRAASDRAFAALDAHISALVDKAKNAK